MKTLRLLCDCIYFSADKTLLPSSTTTGTAATGSHTSTVSSQPTKDNFNSEELITVSSDLVWTSSIDDLGVHSQQLLTSYTTIMTRYTSRN